MRRTIPLLALVSVVLALTAQPAAAGRPYPYTVDDLLFKGCGFRVLIDVSGGVTEHWFTDADGTVRLISNPAYGTTVTATNVKTRTSVTVGYNGTLLMAWTPDGTWTEAAVGQWVWLENPETGEPGLWYTIGQLTKAGDAEDNVTFLGLDGQLIDLCSQLAS